MFVDFTFINLSGCCSLMRNYCTSGMRVSFAMSLQVVVGNVSKNICCMQVVLNFGGNIGCTITGPRHYSFDLRKDDLGIPCRLV